MSDGIVDVGDAISAGLVAREIDRAHADRPAVGHGVHEPCANCGTIRQGAWCHACGQAGHVHRSAGALVHDIAHGVFHFEGKLWSTLPLLAWRPGELTRRYVYGERAKFVSPMALFLFSVFLLFTVVAHLPDGGGGSDQRDAARRHMSAEQAQAETRLAALDQARDAVSGAAAQKALDAEIASAHEDVQALAIPKIGLGEADGRPLEINTSWRWLDEAIRRASANPDLTLYKLKSYGYKYSWALVPISLPFLWLLFAFRRDVGLYDHAIFAIYSLSFMSLAVVVAAVASAIGLSGGLVALAVMLVPPLHMYRQLKGAYLLGRFGALWRTAALLVITAICASLFLAFLFWMGTD